MKVGRLSLTAWSSGWKLAGTRLDLVWSSDSVFLIVWGKGGMFVFLRSPRQRRDAFLDLTEYESIQESDGRAFRAEQATTVCT